MTVVTPAVQGKDISKGHKAPTPLPALETLQFSAGDSTEDDDTLGDEEDGRSSEPQDGESSLDERITNPQSVEDICLSIIHVLSK